MAEDLKIQWKPEYGVITREELQTAESKIINGSVFYQIEGDQGETITFTMDQFNKLRNGVAKNSKMTISEEDDDFKNFRNQIRVKTQFKDKAELREALSRTLPFIDKDAQVNAIWKYLEDGYGIGEALMFIGITASQSTDIAGGIMKLVNWAQTGLEPITKRRDTNTGHQGMNQLNNIANVGTSGFRFVNGLTITLEGLFDMGSGALKAEDILNNVIARADRTTMRNLGERLKEAEKKDGFKDVISKDTMTAISANHRFPKGVMGEKLLEGMNNALALRWIELKEAALAAGATKEEIKYIETEFKKSVANKTGISAPQGKDFSLPAATLALEITKTYEQLITMNPADLPQDLLAKITKAEHLQGTTQAEKDAILATVVYAMALQTQKTQDLTNDQVSTGSNRVIEGYEMIRDSVQDVTGFGRNLKDNINTGVEGIDRTKDVLLSGTTAVDATGKLLTGDFKDAGRAYLRFAEEITGGFFDFGGKTIEEKLTAVNTKLKEGLKLAGLDKDVDFTKAIETYCKSDNTNDVDKAMQIISDKLEKISPELKESLLKLIDSKKALLGEFKTLETTVTSKKTEYDAALKKFAVTDALLKNEKFEGLINEYSQDDKKLKAKLTELWGEYINANDAGKVKIKKEIIEIFKSTGRTTDQNELDNVFNEMKTAITGNSSTSTIATVSDAREQVRQAELDVARAEDNLRLQIDIVEAGGKDAYEAKKNLPLAKGRLDALEDRKAKYEDLVEARDALLIQKGGLFDSDKKLTREELSPAVKAKYDELDKQIKAIEANTKKDLEAWKIDIPKGTKPEALIDLAIQGTEAKITDLEKTIKKGRAGVEKKYRSDNWGWAGGVDADKAQEVKDARAALEAAKARKKQLADALEKVEDAQEAYTNAVEDMNDENPTAVQKLQKAASAKPQDTYTLPPAFQQWKTNPQDESHTMDIPGKKGTITIYKDGREVHNYTENGKTVRTVTFYPDGRAVMVDMITGEETEHIDKKARAAYNSAQEANKILDRKFDDLMKAMLGEKEAAELEKQINGDPKKKRLLMANLMLGTLLKSGALDEKFIEEHGERIRNMAENGGSDLWNFMDNLTTKGFSTNVYNNSENAGEQSVGQHTLNWIEHLATGTIKQMTKHPVTAADVLALEALCLRTGAAATNMAIGLYEFTTGVHKTIKSTDSWTTTDGDRRQANGFAKMAIGGTLLGFHDNRTAIIDHCCWHGRHGSASQAFGGKCPIFDPTTGGWTN